MSQIPAEFTLLVSDTIKAIQQQKGPFSVSSDIDITIGNVTKMGLLHVVLLLCTNTHEPIQEIMMVFLISERRTTTCVLHSQKAGSLM